MRQGRRPQAARRQMLFELVQGAFFEGPHTWLRGQGSARQVGQALAQARSPSEHPPA
jgi:hypothetical protein